MQANEIITAGTQREGHTLTREEAHFATLKTGLCNAYIAASVFSSKLVATAEIIDVEMVSVLQGDWRNVNSSAIGMPYWSSNQSQSSQHTSLQYPFSPGREGLKARV